MTLTIQLRSSRLLFIYLLSIHLLAALAAWFSALPGWGMLLLCLVLLFSLRRGIRRYTWRGERSLGYQDGSWALVGAGKRQDLQLAGESFVHPWLSILRFKSAEGVVILLLPPDSASAAELRQLRRVLRFGLQSDPPQGH